MMRSRAVSIGFLVFLGGTLLNAMHPAPAPEAIRAGIRSPEPLQPSESPMALKPPVRAVSHPLVWHPAFEWHHGSADWTRWTLAQQLLIHVTRSEHLLVRQERSMFREWGIAPVSDDAIGLDWQHATDRFDAAGRWESSSGWSGGLRGRLEWMSDENRYASTELEAAHRVPGVEGLRAVYLWTTENAVERRYTYDTPHSTMLHQLGGDLSLAGRRWWLWGRYLFGFDQALGARNGDVHAVDLTMSVPFLGPATLEPAFAWSQSPTYRSATYRFLVHYEF